jgi:Leucine-rich repeat (LRR) protein
LQGRLPLELHLLPISFLALSDNEMTGSIPPSYASSWRASLERLELHGNLFSGMIPKAFFNTSFSRSLPSSLTTLRLGDNVLGNLPTEIGRLTKLKELWYHANAMSGTLPSELGRLTLLTGLRLHHNNAVSGRVPATLFQLQRLEQLDLYEMSLSGPLSSLVGKLRSMMHLRLYSNQLTGTVPTQLADLSQLRVLRLEFNQFEGTVPLEFCSLVSPNALEVLQADCFPIERNSKESIICSCCTGCCNPNTLACSAV